MASALDILDDTPHLSIDVDGTLALTMHALCSAVNAKCKTDYTYFDCKALLWHDNFADNPAAMEWAQTFISYEHGSHAATIGFYKSVAPDYAAIAAVQQMHAQGVHINVATHRDPALEDITRWWLKKWNVPYDGLYVGPQSKPNLASAYDFAGPAKLVFVDDGPALIEILADADDAFIYLLRRPNTNVADSGKNWQVIDTWQPVLECAHVVPTDSVPQLTVAIANKSLANAAGICVLAQNTGRILMLQRHLYDDAKDSQGKWEFPGGCVDGDDSLWDTARREWEEETGNKLPKGKLADTYEAKNGYQVFVWLVPTEDGINLNPDAEAMEVRDADHPNAQQTEVCAWWGVKDAKNSRALRDELADFDWKMLKHVIKDADIEPVVKRFGDPGSTQERDSRGEFTTGGDDAHEHYMVTGRVQGMRAGQTVRSTIGPFHSKEEAQREIARQGMTKPQFAYYAPGLLTHNENKSWLEEIDKSFGDPGNTQERAGHGEFGMGNAALEAEIRTSSPFQASPAPPSPTTPSIAVGVGIVAAGVGVPMDYAGLPDPPITFPLNGNKNYPACITDSSSEWGYRTPQGYGKCVVGSGPEIVFAPPPGQPYPTPEPAGDPYPQELSARAHMLKSFGDPGNTQERVEHGEFGAGSGDRRSTRSDDPMQSTPIPAGTHVTDALTARYANDPEFTRDSSGTHEGDSLTEGYSINSGPITASEVQGTNSVEVTPAEYEAISAHGSDILAAASLNGSSSTAASAAATQQAFDAVQSQWGGVSIDSHTGEVITPSTGYAVTIRDEGQGSVTLSAEDAANPELFAAAMAQAQSAFATQLESQGAVLGVFENGAGTVEIDPAMILGSRAESDAVGAATHATGGAYNFADGNGYWPPHIADVAPLPEIQRYLSILNDVFKSWGEGGNAQGRDEHTGEFTESTNAPQMGGDRSFANHAQGEPTEKDFAGKMKSAEAGGVKFGGVGADGQPLPTGGHLSETIQADLQAHAIMDDTRQARAMEIYQQYHDIAVSQMPNVPSSVACAMVAVCSQNNTMGPTSTGGSPTIGMAVNAYNALEENPPVEITQEMTEALDSKGNLAFPAMDENGHDVLDQQMQPGVYQLSELSPLAAARMMGVGLCGPADDCVRMYRGESPNDVIDSPKLRNFADNIDNPNDPRALTCDRWAARSCLLGPDTTFQVIEANDALGIKGRDDAEEWRSSGKTNAAYAILAENIEYFATHNALNSDGSSRTVVPSQAQAITWPGSGAYMNTFKQYGYDQ